MTLARRYLSLRSCLRSCGQVLGTPVHCTIEVVEHFNNYVTRHYYALTGTLRFRTFSLRLLLTHAINSKDSIIKIQQHISPQKNYHVNKLARADTVCLITASDRK